MYSYGKTQREKNVTKNIVYSNIPKFMKIHVWKDEISNEIITKFQKNYFDIFLTIKYRWHNNSKSRVNSKQKAWKTVSNIQGIDKIQREIKKNLRRFTIKIRNYYFWLLFVARKNFFKFDKLLARMVTLAVLTK